MTETADLSGAAAPGDASTELLTFLLADLRGFTAYTHQHGDEAGAALSQRFLSLCRDVVAPYDGKMFGSAGDQALVAFASARQALRAAVELQQRLATEQQLHPGQPYGAGVGLDAGEAVRAGDDYRGGAINLAARLCSIAGPGEIFASEGVIHLARATEGLAFLDRGAVSLKGLELPVRVIQIVPEGADVEDLPPLQPILVTHPTNLPDEPTPFIGREHEIDQIARLLRDPAVRLVTLTGPGGTGKTRLALQIGNILLHDFRDGVFFVNLAPLADPVLVPSAIAEVLEVKEEAGADLLATVVEYLRDTHLLLVLDNFEHLLDASAAVAALLDACRNLHVLVTSRIPLRLSREHEHAVPSLSVPDPAHLPAPDQVSQYESVALFADRARAVKQGFEVTTENAPAVAEICHRLDGLPLAVELAAARIKLFPPQALLQRLGNHKGSYLQLLTGGARDRPTRQQTLRNTIDWSYSLLSEEEQALFARLSVFVGGCTFEAAEAICNVEGELDLLEGMASLVDKSLLKQDGESEPRFGMLETIREYATEKLSEWGEDEQLRGAHAAYFLEMAEQARTELRGPRQGEWHAQLDRELDNLRAAMQALLDQGAVEEELRLAGALFWYWMPRGRAGEGGRWLDEGLARAGDRVSPEERVRALWSVGSLAAFRGEFERATSLLEESLTLSRQLGDTRGTGNALSSLGNVARQQGRSDQAAVLYEEALSLFRELGEPMRIATLLGNLGILAQDGGDWSSARERYQETLGIFRSAGDQYGTAWALHVLGSVAVQEGNLTEAERYLKEGLSIAQGAGAKEQVAYMLNSLGELARRQGKLEVAGASLLEALTLARELAEPRFIIGVLSELAALALAQGYGAPAARLKGAETALRERMNLPVPPTVQAIEEETVARIRALLTSEDFARAWERGRGMTLDEAVDYGSEAGAAQA